MWKLLEKIGSFILAVGVSSAMLFVYYVVYPFVTGRF